MSIKTFAISICQTLFLFFWSPPLVKPLTTKPPSSSTLNSQSTPSTRGQVNSRAPCDGVHRIRVDFKRNHDVEKVWEAGGLSLLTSVPITPRVLCFLCASSGNAEVKIILIFFFPSPLWASFHPRRSWAYIQTRLPLSLSLHVVCLLPGMLWTVPSLLPGGIGAPSPGAVWELVLSTMPILPGLWAPAPEN